MRIVIIGAGGHAQVIADILLEMGRSGSDVHPLGYLDDNPAFSGTAPLGLPVLGNISDLALIEHDAIIIGIGNNSIRHKLYCNLQSQGEKFAIARHPDAVISVHVPIGLGSVICAGVVVNTGCRIGVNTILNTGCTIDHHNTIGDHAHIAPGVHLGGDVSIGDGSMVGIGAIVLPQRTLGSWSMIGAGSVVTKSFPDSIVAVGTPAQIIRIQNEGQQ